MFSYTYGSAATKPEFGESLSESVSSVAYVASIGTTTVSHRS